MNFSNNKLINITIWTAIPVIIFAIYLFTLSSNNLPKLVRGNAVYPPVAIKNLSLKDQNNVVVNTKRLKGHWTFVFFGFTHCPDVCPATIAQLKKIKKDIHSNTDYGAVTQFFFVSVDPQRDSLEHLSAYMKYFDPSFIAMTGEQNKISTFEEQLGAFHRLGKKNADGNYNVQHSADIFLINTRAELIAKFQPPMDTEIITQQFSTFVALEETAENNKLSENNLESRLFQTELPVIENQHGKWVV